MEEKTNTIISSLTIITSVFVLVGSFVIAFFLYFKSRKAKLLADNQALRHLYLEQLEQARMEIQEQTYQQIGKELHDNVGQLLSTSRMLLGLTERKLDEPPESLLTANDTLEKAIRELRSLSHSLDRDWLLRFDLMENLQAEIVRINSGNSGLAELKVDGTIPLSVDNQIILYRIVQEALQNAIKHARATKITIQCWQETTNLNICVTDNGTGFNTEQVSAGMGTANMRNRARLLGGGIVWQSAPNAGTSVLINLPINLS